MATSHSVDPTATSTPAENTLNTPRKPGWFSWTTVREILSAIAFSLLTTAGIIVLTVILINLFPQARQHGSTSDSFLLLISTIIVLTVVLLTIALQIRSLLLQEALRAKRARLKVLHPNLYAHIDDGLHAALHHQTTA